MDKKLNILVAEDSEDIRYLVSIYLKKTLHYVDYAHNGLQACKMTEAKRYDLIVIDMQMPVMDGLTAVAKIREYQHQQGDRPTKIFAFTAFSEPKDVQKILANGCDGIIPKPMNKQIFLQAIEGVAMEDY